MKKLVYAFIGRLLGVPMLLIGVIMLAIHHTTHQPTNILLFAAMICVIAGIAGYIWRVKRAGRY